MTTEEILQINGGRKLSGGRVAISGSPNQVTKCVIASLLTDEKVIIKNTPEVSELNAVNELVQSLGAEVEKLEQHILRISAKSVTKYEISSEICARNRLAILAVGPLLHRFKRAEIYVALGGDQIGKRPVNFHLDGLRAMGAQIEYVGNKCIITVDGNGLSGTHIVLPFPSVMTTENLIMTATLAKGRTVIENAAIEPEIIELVKMLQKMGADIMMNANRTFIINGVKKLCGCELRVMSDRNQAVSFAVAALATGGNVLLEKLPHEPVYSFLNFIQRMGAYFKVNSEGVYVSVPNGKPLHGTHIEVEVHPGFMTDWQQPFMVLFTQAVGVSVLHETIFENRLEYTKYLSQMGANISLFSSCLGEAPCRFKHHNHVHSAVIFGPTPLIAGNFKLPQDIRAGMCLVAAGLVAEGSTHLSNIHEIQRKYDNFVPKLLAMGADVQVLKSPL